MTATVRSLLLAIALYLGVRDGLDRAGGRFAGTR